MNETISNVLWFVAAVILAGTVIAGVWYYAMGFMMHEDFMVTDMAAYADGVVYITVKNSGTVPITRIVIDGVEAHAVNVSSLEPGREAQYKATGLSLAGGTSHTFEITAYFSNGRAKTYRRTEFVKPAP